MNERICAVVVTYNRKNLLRACLQSLLAQTRPADRIVVVDNLSTDGTLDLLAAEFPQLQVLALPKNSGGAGGFHAGMKWAFEQQYDWIWVMDDDIRAHPDTLERLLSYGDIGDLIQARKIENGKLLIWEAVWDLNACVPITMKRDLSFANGKPWTSVSYANFEGAFIRRIVIEKVGLPDARYFIAGDDSIYGFLASFCARVIYVDFPGMAKEYPTGNPQSRFYYYFPLRNRFLHYEHFVNAGLPISRKIFLMNTLFYMAGLLREIAQRPKERSWRNVKTVFQAWRDGLAGRFGKPAWI